MAEAGMPLPMRCWRCLSRSRPRDNQRPIALFAAHLPLIGIYGAGLRNDGPDFRARVSRDARMKVLGTGAGGIAWEIQSPLTGTVAGCSHTLQDSCCLEPVINLVPLFALG